MMNRIKIFAAAHKALRMLLSQFSDLIAQTNFNDLEQLGKLKTVGSELFELLNDHAHTEDEFILEALEKKLLGAAEHDRNEHQVIEDLQSRLQAELNSFWEDTDSNTAHTFYLNFTQFHSLYLHHIWEEETITQQLLWDNFSDAEIFAVRMQIIQKTEFQMALKWWKYMIMAQNESENHLLWGALKSNLPPEKFAGLLNILNHSLSTEKYHSLLKENSFA